MSAAADLETHRPPSTSLSIDGGAATVTLAGDWELVTGVPSSDSIVAEIAAARVSSVVFDASPLGRWDSGLLIFLVRVERQLEDGSVQVDRSALPDGVKRLLALREAVPEKSDARARGLRRSFLARVGAETDERWRGVIEAFEFVGELVYAFGKWIRGQARFRRSDFFLFVQQAGADAVPIVGLISFLVGMIFAFVGAVQLQQFGATIYIANMVGVAMVRDMGAMMTAIVMAGRTGAAYAAQLGSMKVTQEIDALVTMGISPIEYLVLPRMLALALMMPLLCLYSDAIGILGGAFVGVGILGLSPTTYYQYTDWAVTMNQIVGGISKASVYGILVAICGCLRGMQSGTSSSAVGDATTSAVVSSIVAIITACGVFAVVFYVFDI